MFAPPTAIYTHGPGLIRSLFIEVHVQSLESEWSYICVLMVSILPLSTFILLFFYWILKEFKAQSDFFYFISTQSFC